MMNLIFSPDETLHGWMLKLSWKKDSELTLNSIIFAWSDSAKISRAENDNSYVPKVGSH